MRLRIILSLILLIFTTGCGAKNKKLIELDSELVKDQGSSQICVYNDVFEAYGKKSKYTYIDIIRDNEIKETINTYRYLDRVTDIDCFDFNDDGIKDIALIGYSGAELKVLLYESTSDYHYNVFSGWGDVGEAIRKASNDDFSMDTLKSILEIGGGAYLRRIAGDTAKKAILAAEEVTYSDYKSAYIDFLKVLDEYGFDNCGTEIDSYYIYDIDKDKTPELLVEYGIYGNEKHVWVYTYAENKVRRIDMFDTVNSDFYAYPGGNGIMKYWSHGGGEEYCLFSLNNNNLTSKVMYSGCTIYDDPEMGEDYRFTSARDVVPTTYFLTSFEPDYVYPIEKYEEISSHMPSKDNKSYTFPDNNPNFYSEIMDEDGIVNAVILGWEYETGEVHSNIHFRKNIICDREVTDITYADFNSDGVYECVLYLVKRDEAYEAVEHYRVILSKQGDEVYAYFACSEEDSISKDGFFIYEPNNMYSYRDRERVIYDKEKCFYYSAPY